MLELYKPPARPCDPITKFAVFPWVVIVSCEFSTDSPNHTLLLKFLVTRNAYCRAQLKPTVYCGSIVMGNASLRLSSPCLVSVTKLHICPAVTVMPSCRAAWPQPCLRRRT